MLQIDFPERNLVYGKPKGWTDDQCGELPVWIGQVAIDEAGNTCETIISCIQPSKEDIEAILAGKPIWLFITGQPNIHPGTGNFHFRGQPPVSLSTEYPFVKQDQNP
jgi:hypothetical protein